MESFEAIYQRALERKGSADALAAALPKTRSKRALSASGDDRWLAEMARCIFQAGFVWRVVDNKWPGFEEVFFGFPPDRIVLLSPEQIDRLSQNPKIIRNRQKVVSVQENAQFVLDIAREQGSFGRWVANWPGEDLIGLFEQLKKRGSRLGGMTGQRLLRNMGKDTFIVTPDVVRCLQRAGVDIGVNPSSRTQLRRIQDAFNSWQKESGSGYASLSRICALSV